MQLAVRTLCPISRSVPEKQEGTTDRRRSGRRKEGGGAAAAPQAPPTPARGARRRGRAPRVLLLLEASRAAELAGQVGRAPAPPEAETALWALELSPGALPQVWAKGARPACLPQITFPLRAQIRLLFDSLLHPRGTVLRSRGTPAPGGLSWNVRLKL